MKISCGIIGVLLVSPLFAHKSYSQGYPPSKAEEHMSVADGLKVSLFAHEPDVRQAIFAKCDDRGRLWTIQYLQYPNPAGLKRVKIDRWSRTIYDRIPEPPPQGPQGADKITICEDVDGDGKADKFTDFIDGLNLATGVAFGHGGVFVLNVPYLLFYPDRNHDDVPDSDPEVLLSGFGMEDAQSFANHLTWGPDGWLYGLNGSTTTCNVNGVEFQSGVWRYHPISKKFELFSEGGYNCYGLTFNKNGELFYSTNGGPFIHAMQGAYYYKSFGKHGPLHNLYTYHFFPMLECDKVPGGPPTGGSIYRNQSFPKLYHGKFIAGNFLGHTASWWNIIPKGSTFRAEFGDVLLDSHDTWFGPTDMCIGPDGAMYVSDFFDKRTAHPDPDANWDTSNGRIYKIRPESPSPPFKSDVRQQTTQELVSHLRQDNGWLVDRSLIELAHRRDKSLSEELLEMALQHENSQLALRAVWALNAVNGLDESAVSQLLFHPYEYVRYWVIRLLGDRDKLSSTLASQLTEVADNETSPVVVAQLACTAKRLPPEIALPLIKCLLKSDLLATDERIPWLLWWAIENKAMTATPELVELFSTSENWKYKGIQENALRLIRRWSAEGTESGYQACLKLLQATPFNRTETALNSLRQGLSERSVGLGGIGQGGLFGQIAAEEDTLDVAERHFQPVSDSLRKYLNQVWLKAPSDTLSLEIAIRCNIDGAYERLLKEIQNSTSNEHLINSLKLLRDVGNSKVGTIVLPLITSNQDSSVNLAAIDVLDTHGSVADVESILGRYPDFSPELRSRLRDLFFSRANIAISFLEQVQRGTLPAEEVPLSQISHLATHKDQEIDRLVSQLWGKVGRGSTEEKLATMRRYNNDLFKGPRDAENGKLVFSKHCAICHTLHGEGNRIGPDLTTANRHDRAALLGNIVDPSAVIRREYMSYVALTNSGRVITGLIAEENAADITILDAQNRRITISRDDIDELVPAEVSLMPEKILDPLTPQELRDLFYYLDQG